MHLFDNRPVNPYVVGNMITRNCDNRAQVTYSGGVVLALLGLVLFVLNACEDDPGAPPEPGAVSQMATAVADSNGDADDPDGGFQALGDFEFATDPLPEAGQIYFSVGSDLWKLPEQGEPARVTGDLSIASYSFNAIGDALAVLSLDRDDDRELAEVSILDEDGDAQFELSSEDSEHLRAIESVALNPTGDALALTQQDGAMSLIMLDGEVSPLLHASIQHRPGRLSWSSDGQFLAYLDPWMPDEASSLYVHVPARDIRQQIVQPGSDGHGVIRARWIPGTPYIVMIKDSGSTISHGGDLFLVDVETGRQELLKSSGSIAPVAGLVDIVPSPDGEWLAVTGFVPGDEHPGFAGLWLINLQSGLEEEIDVENGATITDLWWLGDDLVVRAIERPETSLPGTYTGREPFRLLEILPGCGQQVSGGGVLDHDGLGGRDGLPGIAHGLIRCDRGTGPDGDGEDDHCHGVWQFRAPRVLQYARHDHGNSLPRAVGEPGRSLPRADH